MMNGREKSDPTIVAEKPANEPGRPGEESVEPRAGAEGNAGRQSTLRAQDRAGVSQALDRVRKAARQGKTETFTTLLHHVDIRLLRESFFALRRDAAPGVDGMTWAAWEADLEPRLIDLHDRVHRGAYRAQPSRRVMIPKADGKQRPLAIAALEDKIVQKAVLAVLNSIYEEDVCCGSVVSVEANAKLYRRWGTAPRSRPAGAGFKPPQAAGVKSPRGERCGKRRKRFRQVRLKETSESEPLMTCRNVSARL